jgi:hypothetical protein
MSLASLSRISDAIAVALLTGIGASVFAVFGTAVGG